MSLYPRVSMFQNRTRCVLRLLLLWACHFVVCRVGMNLVGAAEASIPIAVSANPAIKLHRFANKTTQLPRVPGGSGYSTEPAFPLLQLGEPIGLASPPGETNRLFVIEKPGRVVVITN